MIEITDPTDEELREELDDPLKGPRALVWGMMLGVGSWVVIIAAVLWWLL